MQPGHFEKKLDRVTSRDGFVLFKEVDFIASAATGVAFSKTNAVAFPDGKRIVLIVVKGTPRTFLRVVVQAQLMHQRSKRQSLFCAADVVVHCPASIRLARNFRRLSTENSLLPRDCPRRRNDTLLMWPPLCNSYNNDLRIENRASTLPRFDRFP